MAGGGAVFGDKESISRFFFSCFVLAFLQTRILPWNKTSLFVCMTIRDYLPITSIKIPLLDICKKYKNMDTALQRLKM